MTNEIKPVYSGEAQLVRWADSGAAGRTITLRIDESDTVHPFRGLKYGDSGQRFEIAVVAKNDDEEPLDADHAKKNATRHKARPKDGYNRSQMAAIKTGDESFQIWLAEKYPTIWDKHYFNIGTNDASPEAADRTLKTICGISSKKELDVPGAAQAAWDKLEATYNYRNQVRG